MYEYSVVVLSCVLLPAGLAMVVSGRLVWGFGQADRPRWLGVAMLCYGVYGLRVLPVTGDWDLLLFFLGVVALSLSRWAPLKRRKQKDDASPGATTAD